MDIGQGQIFQSISNRYITQVVFKTQEGDYLLPPIKSIPAGRPGVERPAVLFFNLQGCGSANQCTPT
jgi:hypothetical protein